MDGARQILPAIENEASSIRELCDVLVVIGIGGSYLGTAAILEALGGRREGCPEVVFAGNNLSGAYHRRLLKHIAGKEICLCVVSKSGKTMESQIAFSILKDCLFRRYGERAKERIVAVTDPEKGILREEAEREGYAVFEIPQNIGGRYSAFTPAILLPLAAAGIDINELVNGAAACAASDFIRNEGLDYALSRFELMNLGKQVEVFEYYNPYYRSIGEWLKQLFAESEGKEKGFCPYL